jgi:hypothetical protein
MVLQPGQGFDGVLYLDRLDGFTKTGPGVGRELKVKSFFHLGIPIFLFIFLAASIGQKKD